MRVGLCGTGYWAQQTWAPTLAAAPEVSLVGVWGRDTAKAERLAGQYGTAAYPSAEQLIADVDVVAISLPPDVQVPIAEQAAHAGRHLLLEKPLSLDIGSARSVARAVDASGVGSVVLFTGRFVPQVADWVEQSRAVPWVGGQVTWLGAPFAQDSPYRESGWRRRHGALWDVGPHALSLLIPTLGPVCENAGAVTASRGPGDTTHLALRHATGASSSVTLSFSVPPAAARQEVALWGEPGWSRMPTDPWDARPALARAISDLVSCVTAQPPLQHACGVRFACEITEVLGRAQDLL